MPNSFLLDTCTLVRLAGFPETLSAATREAIENAWYLYASPVSLWEVIFKCQIGKLELNQPTSCRSQNLSASPFDRNCDGQFRANLRSSSRVEVKIITGFPRGQT